MGARHSSPQTHEGAAGAAAPLAQPALCNVDPFRTSRRFDIFGEAFLAVPQREWTNTKVPSSQESSLHMRVAGRLTIDGVPHVILRARTLTTSAIGSSSIAQILTRRELQIALLVAEGKCDKDTARDLGISNYTVREHMRRIFHKLNVTKRTAVVALVVGRSHCGSESTFDHSPFKEATGKQRSS